MVDMANTIQPKSDQINADDLIGGPRTITVTRVTGNEGNAEQPVNVFFEGDEGKPFRPCKSMRRVMVKIWGADASKYAGQSMTIYRDPKVKWGGMEVGGIRISHMTGIDQPETMALTATRASRKPYTVQPLEIEAKADKAANGADELIARIEAGEDISADAQAQKQIAWLEKKRPELAEKVRAAMPDDDDPFTEQEGGAEQEEATDAPPSDDEPAWAEKVRALKADIDECTTIKALDALEADFDKHSAALPPDVEKSVRNHFAAMRKALNKG